MKFMTGAELASFTQGLISAKKQHGTFSVDLTVSSISRVLSGGSLDFGGSEYKEAGAIALEPEKKSAGEPYGWWNLAPGSYLVTYNEKLNPGEEGVIVVLPHERLVAAGGSHSPLVVEKLDETVHVLLQVGKEGLKIKENARVSKAVVIID